MFMGADLGLRDIMQEGIRIWDIIASVPPQAGLLGIDEAALSPKDVFVSVDNEKKALSAQGSAESKTAFPTNGVYGDFRPQLVEYLKEKDKNGTPIVAGGKFVYRTDTKSVSKRIYNNFDFPHFIPKTKVYLDVGGEIKDVKRDSSGKITDLEFQFGNITIYFEEPQIIYFNFDTSKHTMNPFDTEKASQFKPSVIAAVDGISIRSDSDEYPNVQLLSGSRKYSKDRGWLTWVWDSNKLLCTIKPQTVYVEPWCGFKTVANSYSDSFIYRLKASPLHNEYLNWKKTTDPVFGVYAYSERVFATPYKDSDFKKSGLDPDKILKDARAKLDELGGKLKEDKKKYSNIMGLEK
jgi:hypothetical protein